jgi:fatty-acyl-CoA synthase
VSVGGGAAVMKGEEMTDLSYTCGTGSTPLLGETIGQNFARVVSAHPDRTALIDVASERTWTYAQLDARTAELAAALTERGIGRGDRVGIWAQNLPEWTLAMYATIRIGAILVNINPAYRSHELDFIVEHSGLKLLISQIAAPPHSDFIAIAREVQDEHPFDLVFIDTAPTALCETDHPLPDAERLSALCAAGIRLMEDPGIRMSARLARIGAELDPDDPINLQYTSGTTGFPKGVTLSHHNILNNGYSIGEMLNYSEEDSVVLPVPFFHCFGMVIGTLAAFSHGAATVIPAPAFDPARTLAAVQRTRASSLYGVPTMFIAELALADLADYDLSSLRTGVMAGSTCPVEVMRKVIETMHMPEVAICYGMTETAPVSMMTRTDDSLERRTQTVGRAMPFVEIKIVDPATGLQVPRGIKGELCTRGYSVMRGYWEQPDKTAESIDSGRWMHTGDLAIMNDDGYVDVAGRIKDLVIRGGENIAPREIEEFLYTHPDIADVQVVGVPDAKYGEELMAWVILREGAPELTAEGLREFCAGRLAHYKIPRYVQRRESFPMTVSGKVRKVELRAEGAQLTS